jgi:hypothetical protein
MKFYANLAKSATDILAMIRQAFGEEIVNCTWKVQINGDRKMRDRWKAI